MGGFSEQGEEKLFDLGAWIENDAGLTNNGKNYLTGFRKGAKG
jgi:hypothetical protein